MEKTLLEYIKKFQRNHRNGRRYVAVLLILAMVTTLVVNWNLRGTGIAATADYECGLEEHVHDKDCYELVCTKDGEDGNIRWSDLDDEEDASESETEAELEEKTDEEITASPSNAEKGGSGEKIHVHTKKCYRLICELPEHVHTLKCMSNIASDVEKKADWESTLPEFTSDESQAEKMVAVAESQIGYHESEDNFKLADDGETKQGYTRYGEWYGNPYGNWSAMFAAFVLHYAGVSKSDFPVNSGCQAWIAELEKKGIYKAADSYEPNYGDVAFLDLDEDGRADHVGVITDLERDEEKEQMISFQAVVGDLDDEVQESSYEAEVQEILGYGILPENGTSLLPDESSSQNLTDVADTLEFVLYKKVGDTWKEVGDGETLSDQDEIKVAIKYSVSADKVTDEKRTLIYQLPKGVYPKNALSGKITGTVGGTTYDDLGDYTISESGLIKIVFNDTFIQNHYEFTGGLEMTGKVSLDSGSTGEQIKFTSDGKTYTILPKETESDLTVKKEVTKTEDGKLVYTITARSESGTNDSVKIQDCLTWSGLETVTAGDPTVKKDGTDFSYDNADYKVNSGSGYRNFELNLPKLGAGESYTITYPVDYGKVNSKDGSALIGNTAKGFDGGKWKGESHTHTEISKKMIEKYGSVSDDDNNNAIKWTIRVNPEKQTGVSGPWTISDALNGETLDLSKVDDLKVIKEEQNGVQTDVTEEFLKNNGVITSADGCSYTITYKTPVNLGTDSSKKYTNKVDISDGDHNYSAEGSTTVKKNDEFKEKKAARQELETADLVKQLWTITLNPEKGSDRELEITDTMLDNKGEIDPETHWTTKEMLESALKKLSAEIKWDLTCYDENGVEVSDDENKVVSFVVKLSPVSKWDGKAVNINYNSLFSIRDIDAGDSFQVTNRATMDGVDHDATAKWEKKKHLLKYVQAADQGWHSGSYDVDYDVINKELTYRIIVVPENNTDKLVVEDTLPGGMSFKEGSIDIKFANPNNHAYYSTYVYNNYDIRSEDHKPNIQIDGNKLTVTIKDGFPESVVNDGAGFVIDYKVVVDDSFWDDLGNTEKEYENIVSWNGRNESQDTTIKRKVPVVEKDGIQITAPDTGQPTRDIQYWVTINPAGKQLNGGKPLTLYDHLVTNGVSVSLDPNSVKLYSFDGTKEADHYKGQLLTSSAFQFQYDEEKKQFMVVVPDGTPCVLEYIYTVENMNNHTAATFSNSAELTGSGDTTTSKDLKIVEADSSAWVIKSDKLTIVKVDADRYQVTLPGAEFQLEKLSDSGSWTVCGTYETGDSGTCDILLSGTEKNQLYRIVETKAPSGYEKSGTYYYMVPLGVNTTKDGWLNENKTKLEAQGINQSDVIFIEANGYDVLYVPNQMKTLKVVKLWQDHNGDPITGSMPVKVQLYRNTQMLDCKTVTVQFPKSWPKDQYFMVKKYQVKPGTTFTFQLDFNGSTTLNDGTKEHQLTSKNGIISFEYGNVTEDVVLSVAGGWDGMESNANFKAFYTPAEWKTDTSETVGEPITLNPGNGYTYAWEDLPVQGEDGRLYYYTVQEVDPPRGYTVSYLNNEGTQRGEIVITNRKEFIDDGYELPETGGTGTIPFRTAGLAIISLAMLTGGILKRRREGRN